MTRAFCWEMVLAHGPSDGCRVLVADRFVCTQPLERGNGRPRWIIEETAGRNAALSRALAITGHLETNYAAALTAAPVRIALRDAEVAALRNGMVIPAPLRVRTFTALSRARERAA
jgi:hypothetical protein